MSLAFDPGHFGFVNPEFAWAAKIFHSPELKHAAAIDEEPAYLGATGLADRPL